MVFGVNRKEIDHSLLQNETSTPQWLKRPDNICHLDSNYLLSTHPADLRVWARQQFRDPVSTLSAIGYVTVLGDTGFDD